MDIAGVHRAFIQHAVDHTDIWSAISPVRPAAVVLFGMPTASEQFGYMVMAGKAVSTLAAVDYISVCMNDEANLGIFDGFYGPAQHLFAFRFMSPTMLSVVGWSHSGHASIGSIVKPPHPEFDTRIDLLSVPTRMSPVTKQHFDLMLLAQLSDVGSIVDRGAQRAEPL